MNDRRLTYIEVLLDTDPELTLEQREELGQGVVDALAEYIVAVGLTVRGLQATTRQVSRRLDDGEQGLPVASAALTGTMN